MRISRRRAHAFACWSLALVLVAIAGIIPCVGSSALGHVGVSYLTLHHSYDTQTETLERDFAKFRNDGIRTIAIVMFWYKLEMSRGVYNQEFIENVIRVCNVADRYGLEVMIDFHTIANEEDSWTNPEYVGIAMRLITDPEIADAYVAMVGWAVGQLKDVRNIWAYSVLNEPWFWPLDEWRKTNWINLMVEVSNKTRQITNKPVTIRFVSALFERDWDWDDRLLTALDFISLNARVSESETDDVYWNNFDEYRSGLTHITQKAASLGKHVQITEFGYSTSDDALQAERYRIYTDIFKSTQNLIGWLSWCWDRGYDPHNPSSDAIAACSIFDPISETTRPAYLYITRSTRTEITVTQGEVKTGFCLTVSNLGEAEVHVVMNASGSAAGWVEPKIVDFGIVGTGQEKRIDNAFTLSVPETAPSGTYILDWVCYIADTSQELFVESYSIQVTEKTQQQGASVPGFPIEAILAGLVVGVSVLVFIRRQRNTPETPRSCLGIRLDRSSSCIESQ